jgi:hypothetical protein
MEAFMKLRILVSLQVLLLSLCPLVLSQVVKMKDRSDWWSIYNENYRAPNMEVRNDGVNAKNFEISGVKLGTDGFKNIAAKLGKATVVQRGDASTGRQQVCYTSDAQLEKTYLIFEFGEDDSIFYLFTGDEGWTGSDLCVRSKQVSSNLSTASGLRLGLILEQFTTLLGRADAIVGNRLLYSRHVKKKATRERFEQQRKEYPEVLTDEQAHEKFDFYTVVIYIEANFTDSKLSYLAVSKSGE